VSFNEHNEQPAIAGQLQRSLKRGRLAHAYLFHGPRGSDKEAMARTLAKALNCLKKTHDCCDACDSCRRIDAGVHPDVYWVRPESKSRRITVEQIREFENAVNLKPSLGRVKVGVLVDADCLGEEASNAFLKTLEEPPAQTIIILLTAEPQRLLPTILSRCLRISFGPSGARAASPYRAQLLPLLSKFTTADSQRVVNAYQLLADLTAVLRQIQNEIRRRVEAETNLDRYEELEPKVREKLDDQMEARIEGEYRAAREQILEELYAWFGDVLLCVTGGDNDLLANPEQAGALRAVAGRVTYPQAAANLDAIEQVRDALGRSISESLALEVGLLKLSQ
jgi:DNA polymerase-3 subunit delta'